MPDQFYQYSFFKPWLWFIIVQVVGLVVLTAGISGLVSVWRQGKATSFRRPVNLKLMLRALVYDVVLQTQILRLGFWRWVTHVSIAWGFVGLFFLTAAVALVEHVIPHGWGLRDYFILNDGRFVLEAWGDFWGLLLLFGLALAALRRWVFRSEQLDTLTEDTTLLLFLFVLDATGFLLEAFRLSNIPDAPGASSSFLGYLLSLPLRSVGVAAQYSSALWIFHMLAAALFVAYIPFSKLMHAFTIPAQSLVNISEEVGRADVYKW